MKKIGKIICYILSILIIIFSLIFIFLEARNLLSGDYLLYENKFDGFIRYFFRLLVALFAFSLAIFTYFALSKKENKILQIYFYFGTIALLMSSIVIAIFASNYIDILLLTLSTLFSIGVLLYFVGSYRLFKR